MNSILSNSNTAPVSLVLIFAGLATFAAACGGLDGPQATNESLLASRASSFDSVDVEPAPAGEDALDDEDAFAGEDTFVSEEAFVSADASVGEEVPVEEVPVEDLAVPPVNVSCFGTSVASAKTVGLWLGYNDRCEQQANGNWMLVSDVDCDCEQQYTGYCTGAIDNKCSGNNNKTEFTLTAVKASNKEFGSEFACRYILNAASVLLLGAVGSTDPNTDCSTECSSRAPKVLPTYTCPAM